LSGCRAELPAVGRSKRSGWKACWGKLGRRAWDEKISAGLIREGYPTGQVPTPFASGQFVAIFGGSFRYGCALRAMYAEGDQSGRFLGVRQGGRAVPLPASGSKGHWMAKTEVEIAAPELVRALKSVIPEAGEKAVIA
jgi:hypothetical protein